jgi:hypothetical protein
MPYSVSPHLKLRSLSPPTSKPRKNFSHFTPQALATRKCPSSCTKITKPRPPATCRITPQFAGWTIHSAHVAAARAAASSPGPITHAST